MNEYDHHGFGGFGYLTPAPPTKRKRPETDSELRARIAYVAGEGQYNIKRISAYTGEDLDDLAAEFELKRRTIEE
jgi:hypothetical protein